jgi:hypothetical protein
LKTGTLFMCEYWPVNSVARLGVQIELVTKEFVNLTPSAASRSRFGVLFTLEPYAEIACSAWSSEKMKSMLGRCASALVDWMRTVDNANRTSEKRSSVISGNLVALVISKDHFIYAPEERRPKKIERS